MAISLWADIYEPTFTNTVADGPIPLLNVSITRKLDGLTLLSAEVPPSLERALTHIQARRVADVYMQVVTPAHMPAQAKRSLGAFILDDLSMSKSYGSWTRSMEGRELLLQLKQTTLFPGTIFDAETMDDIFNNATNGLAAKFGWTADVDVAIASDLFSIRFDGSNPLKGIQTVVQAQGVHFRSSLDTANTIEVGAFGDTLTDGSGVIVAAEYVEGETDRTIQPMVIDSLRVSTSAGSDFYNKALYYGAGKGDARLTMEQSNRPWVVKVTENSRDHWIVKDDFSIATYGEVMPPAPLQFSRIAPVGPSEAQVQAAANALADAAKADMDRKSTPLTTYSITVRNVNTTVRPGDKILVKYRGNVYRDSITAPYTWLDLNELMWVTSVRETISADGVALQLEVATIDRYMLDSADVIVGAIDKIEVEGVGVQPYPVRYPLGPYQDYLDSSNPVTFEFPVDAAVLRGVGFSLTLRRKVLTSTTQGAASGGGSVASSAAGGDHRHKMFENGFGAVMPGNNASYRAWSAPGGTGAVTLGVYANPVASDVYTASSSGSHSHNVTIPPHVHDLIYGIFRDSSANKFIDCTVTVNGVDVTPGGGLFMTTGADDEEVIDITAEVLGKAGGFRGDHTIVISCDSGQGEILAELLYDVEIGTVRA